MSKTGEFQALNLDISQQQSFVRFFRNLPEKPSSTVRFFSRSDYYTLHDEDATLAADFTAATIKYMGEEPKLSYVCVNKNQFESLIRELLLFRQYRVEVYTKPAQSKANDWTVQYKGSPGNLSQFEEILFENGCYTTSNSVMGIQFVKSGLLAIASVNLTEVKFEVCELSDNECFSELEALVAQTSPKECVIPTGDTQELVTLKSVLERNGILVAKLNKKEFKAEDIMQDLNRLLLFHEGQQRRAETFKETGLQSCMACLQAIISFLNLTGDERNFNQFKLSSFDVHRFVRLDNAALYALNAFPQTGSSNTMENSVLLPNASKTFSLMGVLDNCVTVQGHRLLERWIKQPLKDYNLINERLDIVECLIKNAEIRSTLIKDTLTRLPDLLILSKKLSNKKANLQDCYKVYQTVGNIPNLLSTLRKLENKCVECALIDPIVEIGKDLEKYQSMVEQVLDLSLVDRGEFLVKSDLNEDLEELSDKKKRIEEKMHKQFQLAAEDLGLEEGKSIKLEHNDQHGCYLRVSLKEEHGLRNNKRFRIIDAVKGGVRFTTEKLSDLNQEYLEIRESYEEQQKIVVSEILDVAAGYADSLRSLNMLVATLDVFASFANSAVMAKIPYVRPNLHKQGSGILKLKKARHPCLEQQDNVAFIPNDVEFDKNAKLFHIITGPNMCGKSTYIRSVGACVLLAHIGSFVPCDQAEISIVDAILARVGSDDCQLKGLSTFMMEMIETSTIIKSATSDSLVIIDELGRGTSTYDGCGIAWAIAEYLAKEVKCFSLFATHYHEITRLSEMFQSIGNLHVSAITTDKTITPLYQIRDGECDKSYGIHCARIVGFPSDVIEWTIQHQTELEHLQGKRFIKDFEPSIKRKVIEEGDKIVKDTLEKIKNTDNISDEDLMKLVGDLKVELEGSNNLFIKGLLSE